MFSLELMYSASLVVLTYGVELVVAMVEEAEEVIVETVRKM